MPLGMLGQKIGMTQVYDETGRQFPVTVLRVGPNPILLVRDQKRDGYDAIQVGFLDKARRKANCEPQRVIREYRLAKADDNLRVGNLLRCEEVFKDVKAVDVTAKSKGRGT